MKSVSFLQKNHHCPFLSKWRYRFSTNTDRFQLIPFLAAPAHALPWIWEWAEAGQDVSWQVGSGSGMGMAAAKLWGSSGRGWGQELSSRTTPDKRNDPGPDFNRPFTQAINLAGPEPRLPNPQEQGETWSGHWCMWFNSKYPSYKSNILLTLIIEVEIFKIIAGYGSSTWQLSALLP